MDTLALALSMLFYVRASRRSCSRSRQGRWRGRRGRVLRAAAGVDRRHGDARGRREPGHAVRGLELLSIPLYVLCAAEVRRATPLEAGLKYLVIGSVGSATLLYGLALIYGATGATDFSRDRQRHRRHRDATDPLLLTGIALAATGLAFKASVAPFHQWTPDVYQGAPTPITTFMAVATKAAAFASSCASSTRRFQPQPTGARARRAGHGDDPDRQRRRDRRSARSSGCWPGRASHRRATCSPASSSAPSWALQATVFYLAVYLL